MRKATRILLEFCPNAKHVLVEMVVIEGAKENHCWQNAIDLATTNEADLIVVSGWLVGEFFKEKGTAIIPHYFVKNEKTNKYYDSTPFMINDIQSYEYVEDFEIFLNGNEESILPLALNIAEKGLVKARSSDGTYYIDLEKIDVAQLYELRKTN